MHRFPVRSTARGGRRAAVMRLLTAAGGAALAGTSGLARADDFPSKPIRIIVPYGPGGNTDIVARAYGDGLASKLGQPIVFDNRAGAAGTLGVGLAAKAPADGYNLVIGDIGSMVIATHSIPSLAYRPLQDLAPVALIAAVSIVVSVLPDSPINTFGDLIARAKAAPGKLTYGTGGVGSPGHLAMELVRSMTGIDVVHVPFKGGAQAVTGMIGGHIDFLVDGTALAQIRNGRLKAIAVTGPRLPVLPDTPGIGETVKGFDFTNWWGVLAPAGTPASAVKRVNAAFHELAAQPAIREKLASLGLSARDGSPEDFGRHLAAETEKVDQIVRKAGIRF